jgi:hypothetical protein
MTNEETDTALILENELKRRVTEVLGTIVHKIVHKAIEANYAQHKSTMMLEVAVAVGKMLRSIEEDGRKPLWQATPEEFGLTQQDMNIHALGRREGYNHSKLDNAIPQTTKD